MIRRCAEDEWVYGVCGVCVVGMGQGGSGMGSGWVLWCGVVMGLGRVWEGVRRGFVVWGGKGLG